MPNHVSRVKIFSLLALTAMAVIASFLSVGYYPGIDAPFHVGFWFEMARQWREGVVYPRWAAQSMYGYGNPTMIFYPPLSRILGGVLVILLPARWAVGAYAWVGLVIGGFGCFQLCREVFDDRSSLVGAFAYVFNPYCLFVLYVRSAFSEFLAAAIFPWFLLAACRLDEKKKRSVALLGLFVALLWLTNIPAGVIASYAAAMVIITRAWAQRSGRLLVWFALAELLGTGLAMFYLLPAWRQQPLITLSGLRPPQPSTDYLLSKSSIVAAKDYVVLTTGFLWQTAVGCLGCFYARKFRSERPGIFIALAILLAVSAFMCIPPSAFFWKHGPLFSYVQFPWRWLFAVNLSAAFFLAAAVSQTKRQTWVALAACAYPLVLILSCSAVRRRALDWNTFAAPFKSGFIYGDEAYAPRAARYISEEDPLPAWMYSDQFELLGQSGARRMQPGKATPSAPTNPTIVRVQSWQAQSRVFTVDSPEPARIRVRLFYYPGWHVVVNGAEVAPVERDPHDAVLVQTPAGHSRVQLVLKSTPAERWGTIASILAAILVVILSLS